MYKKICTQGKTHKYPYPCLMGMGKDTVKFTQGLPMSNTMYNRWCSQLLFMRCLCLFIYLEQQEIDWWRPGHHINYVCNIEAIEVWLTLLQPWPSLILKEMTQWCKSETDMNNQLLKWLIKVLCKCKQLGAKTCKILFDQSFQVCC